MARNSLAHRLGGDDDAVFLEDPVAEVDDPPAYDAMHGRGSGRPRPSRASAARCSPSSAAASAPRGLPAISSIRPMGVELHHPIANDLERHPADLRRSRSDLRPVVNRRQRQKSLGLRPILRPLRGGPHHPRIKISPKWNGHGGTSALATLNQTHADPGNFSEFALTELVRDPIWTTSQLTVPVVNRNRLTKPSGLGEELMHPACVVRSRAGSAPAYAVSARGLP